MEVTAKIVANMTDTGKLKAIATVCLNNEFLITGVRVVECEKGSCVFMPSRRTRGKGYCDICFPIKAGLYKQIKDAVLEAYRRQAQELSQPM